MALSILNIINGFDGFDDPAQINLTTHRLDEALRWSYGLRVNLGDPSFVANMTEYQANMLSPATATEIRSKISDTRTYNSSYYNPSNIEILSDNGTSHIVAADSTGLTVSITTTINTIFGSRVMVPETGVIMNVSITFYLSRVPVFHVLECCGMQYYFGICSRSNVNFRMR